MLSLINILHGFGKKLEGTSFDGLVTSLGNIVLRSIYF